jgi:hypothetical protein
MVLIMSVFAKPGTPTSKQCPAGENGREDLLDDFVLTDNDTPELLQHPLPRLSELFENGR